MTAEPGAGGPLEADERTVGLSAGISGARPFIVGLTGGIGSGKSTVASLFARHGVPIVDADEIAHLLTRPGGLAIAAIREAFGQRFIDADGAMDRAKMRDHVFADDRARRQLEAILHPLIRDETRRRIAIVMSAQSAQSAPTAGLDDSMRAWSETAETAETAPRYAIVMVPLLFEGGRWKESCDRTLVVDCPEDEQIRRVVRRSGLSEAQVRAIMDRQMARAARVALADDVIDNGADDGAAKSNLATRVDELHRRYRALATDRQAA